MKGALWKLPELKEYTNDVESLKNIANIDTTPYGTDLKTIAYHPMDSTKAVSVVDNKFILWDLADNGPQVKIDLQTIYEYYFLCIILFRQLHLVLWLVKVNHVSQMENGILIMVVISLSH